MSYLKYKPLNKRFKEFVGILTATALGGFIGVLVAVMRTSDISVTGNSPAVLIQTSSNSFMTDSQTLGGTATYGFIGAIIGLTVSVLVVNTSSKRSDD